MLQQILDWQYLWALAFLPGVVLALLSRWRFGVAYRRASQQSLPGQIDGARAARILLDRNGMANFELYEAPARVPDHFDLRRRCLFLSPPVASERNLASIALASHIAAHVIQAKRGVGSLRLRIATISLTGPITVMALVGVTAGLFLQQGFGERLCWLSSGLYFLFTLLHLVSIGTEYHANHLAQSELLKNRVISEGDVAVLKPIFAAIAWLDTPILLDAYLGILGPFGRARASARESV